MVAKILNYGEVYRCSNCYMRMATLFERCPFCCAIFSNYEELAIRAAKEREEQALFTLKYLLKREKSI